MPARAAHDDTLIGRRVTVVGLGRFGGGIGVTRWLHGRGATVTVSDQAEPADLVESIAQLEDLDVKLHLGGHESADFLDTDLLVVSPAVPPDMPLLVQAREKGIPQTTEMNLFLARCPGNIVGITGSVGKSTTTTMLGAMLATRYPTHVGGNIGVCLLDRTGDIGPGDMVVLELSSFQLEWTPQVAVSPHIAVVTNLQPNHLDRHGTMDAYGQAKQNITRFQDIDDVLVLNRADPSLADWATLAPGRVEWFDPAGGEAFELSLPGVHNQANAQAAWAAARLLGISRDTAAEALQHLAPLPHRLEFVGEYDRVRYYNDSKSTTPSGSIVAIEAFPPGQVVLLLGGYDKGLDYAPLAAVALARAAAVVTFGAAGETIARAFSACQGGCDVHRAAGFDEAVATARSLARQRQVVLLSPGCASYDEFVNYEHRGRRFVHLVTPPATK